MESNYQKFKIDEYLKRNKKALDHLRKAGNCRELDSLYELLHFLPGADHFEEAKAFVEKHNMYMDALLLWSEDAGKQKVLQPPPAIVIGEE